MIEPVEDSTSGGSRSLSIIVTVVHRQPLNVNPTNLVLKLDFFSNRTRRLNKTFTTIILNKTTTLRLSLVISNKYKGKKKKYANK